MNSIFDDKLLNTLFSIVGMVLAINLVVLLFRNYVANLFHKAKVTFDKEVLGKIMRPVYYLSLFLIGYFVVIRLDYLSDYSFYLDRGVFAIMVGFLSVFLARLLSVFLNYWLRIKKGTKQTPKLITGTISALIYLSGAIIVLSYWGIQITPLVAALGVGGIAIGLGLQETLSNLFAGLHIVSDEPVKVGDYIEIGTDIAGTVEDIGWRSTRLKTIQNNVVIIPNSHLAKSVIVNLSSESREVSVLVSCGVAYGSDLDKVEKVILDEIEGYQKTNDYIAKGSTSFVRFNEFGDSNINFNVIVKARNYDDRFVIKHELVKLIKSRLDKEKIEISWPVRKIVK
ncbi:mechanosensitive ion channel family protein [Patescibacteria group bacterium]|nr:mechanosensitive ion channel family protein [Patescibacteria group bacterium]